MDPLADIYISISPYIYAANTPINAYDPDGKKVIYVNGYFSRILNLAGLAPGSPKKAYWDYFSGQFIQSSRQFMGAANYELNEFIDGSTYFGGDQSGEDRFNSGVQYAIENYKDLIFGMKKALSLLAIVREVHLQQ